MYRDRFGRRPDYGSAGGRRRRWPRSRAAGCLLWIVLLVVVLIVLSVMFGGFQKGTQVKGLGSVAGGACVSRVVQPDAPSGKDRG
jgi:ABC-type lipoprotein release transport system permease subunit